MSHDVGHKTWWIFDMIGLLICTSIVVLELVLLGLWTDFYDESFFSDSAQKNYFEDLSMVAYLNKGASRSSPQLPAA